MTASSFDQQAWLKRIGYGGPLEPTLGTLRQFIFAHSHAIAYESLDIMPPPDAEAGCGGSSAKDDLWRTRRLLSGTECCSGQVSGHWAIRSPACRAGSCVAWPSTLRDQRFICCCRLSSPKGPIWRTWASATSPPHQHSCCGQALSRRRHTSRCDLSMSVAS